MKIESLNKNITKKYVGALILLFFIYSAWMETEMIGMICLRKKESF